MKKIIIENVDLSLLKEQKTDLIELIDILKKSDMLKTAVDSLRGILNLLDRITDSDIENRILEENTVISDEDLKCKHTHGFVASEHGFICLICKKPHREIIEEKRKQISTNN